MTITIVKPSRTELVDALWKRDGNLCMHPRCNKPLDRNAEGSQEVTIDHREPQSWCRDNGWSEEEIWNLTNLNLMHKACNASKSDTRYLEDGTLPVKENRFVNRRLARAERPEVCVSCSAGRDLGPDEICASCNSGPMPERFPRWAKMKASDCDHEAFWCAWCSIGVLPRAGATEMIILGNEGGAV